MMVVLGINAFHGDAAACLIDDGKIIGAVAEERFTRRKHEGGLPIEAIKWCLSLTNKKIEHIAVSRDASLHRVRKITAVLKNPLLIKHAISRQKNAGKMSTICSDIEEIVGHKIISHNIEHHLAHLAYTYITSDFSDCALLSVDGFGDFVSTSWGEGRGNKLKIDKRVFFPHSLGIFYSALTQFLGFTNYGEEYKVMALASFGVPRYLNLFAQIIQPTEDGFKLSPSFFLHTKGGVAMSYGVGTPVLGKLFSNNLEKVLGPARKRGEVISERHYDIAASLQIITNNLVLHLAKLAKQNCSSENLAISGGVAQNSVSNGVLENSELFKNVWFPSAPADDGTAVGAAAAVALEQGDSFHGKGNSSAFLGPEINASSAKIDLKLIDNVVQLLDQEKIVGWFEGATEFGPRALGHRSILADPRNSDMKIKINAVIKKRESFRPFAPMVLLEDLDRYFVTNKPAPNMMTVVRVREEWRNKISAIVHTDGTARIQTVTDKTLPNIALLLSRWRDKSGISVLLNTSFNENEPIVNTPNEALNCFKRTEMDALVLNGKLFVK